MTVMNAPRSDIDDRLDETFIELICTVDALVDAEFDDILSTRRLGCPPTERHHPWLPRFGHRPEALHVRSIDDVGTPWARGAVPERSPPQRPPHPLVMF
jgi:hypothetical protein